jgi:thiol-disulfide isomerase/thioredoxin
MVSRLFAITLLAVILSGFNAPAMGAKANSFTDQFHPVEPPGVLPLFYFQDNLSHAMTLNDFRGKHILLNLWASWCGPCVQELPSLDALQRKLGPQGFELIALCEDHDGVAAAQAFYTRYGLHALSIFVDSSGRVPAILHVNGLPTSIFIDEKGQETGRMEGNIDWDTPEAVAFVTKWVGKKD